MDAEDQAYSEFESAVQNQTQEIRNKLKEERRQKEKSQKREEKALEKIYKAFESLKKAECPKSRQQKHLVSEARHSPF